MHPLRTLIRRAPLFAVAVCSAALATPALANDTAQAALAADYDAVLEQLITMTEIPAPPFGEAERAAYYRDRFAELGLEQVSIDAEGNVLGLRPGRNGSDGNVLVVSAHLDTVFPIETDVTVRREGDTLYAPGVADDTLGLAALLAWVRALDAGDVETDNPILFVGTVGEEGPGDLRGVRYLHTQGDWADRIGAFISIDGADPSRIVTSAVGSKRYNVVFNGPGGHSYGAYGIVNPMAAMADAVSRLYRIDASDNPRVTYSASVVSGGTSVNTIPDKIELQVDMRSPDPDALAAIEARFLEILEEAETAENLARSTREGMIDIDPQAIGDRPAGSTPADHPLVFAAREGAASQGLEAVLTSSSTDANIAMSLGIPAVTVGTGGGGGRAHTVDEFLNVEQTALMQGLAASLDFVIRAANIALE